MSRKRKRRNRKIWYLLAAVALLCVMAFGYKTVQLYRLRKETEAQIANRVYAQTSESVLFQSGTVEYDGKTYRRNTHVKAILCMGVDRKGTMEGRRTESSS